MGPGRRHLLSRCPTGLSGRYACRIVGQQHGTRRNMLTVSTAWLTIQRIGHRTSEARQRQARS
ncbi:protein of unknown function [Methylorubrum extorquens]|uniref:Uncharacterized protein n=1 Tax=Methylorubrum extorquens TaxID=408 RepID=A0A2N9AMV4_METEX|nr:protein of unknown function [Methylorubrum extorquens]